MTIWILPDLSQRQYVPVESLRPVQVGRTNGRETEVLGGLREGDRVVLYPGDTVADGRSVRPIVVSAR